MLVSCLSCNWSANVLVSPVRYRCGQCQRLITSIDVSCCEKWFIARADARETDRQEGRLPSRKQTTKMSDYDISITGLAACLILAPCRVAEWREIVESPQAKKSNRGEDFPATWFGDGRPVEVKNTEYKDGHLIVRPPSGEGEKMCESFIDDSIYVLVTGKPYTYTARGWAGKNEFCDVRLRKIFPPRNGQLEGWGIRVDKLYSMDSLFPRLDFRKNK